MAWALIGLVALMLLAVATLLVASFTVGAAPAARSSASTASVAAPPSAVRTDTPSRERAEGTPPRLAEYVRRCGRAGWLARHRQVRALLDAHAADGRIRLLDLTRPARFGVDGAGFYDEIHLRPRAAARLVQHVHEHGMLAPAFAGLRGPSPVDAPTTAR